MTWRPFGQTRVVAMRFARRSVRRHSQSNARARSRGCSDSASPQRVIARRTPSSGLRERGPGRTLALVTSLPHRVYHLLRHASAQAVARESVTLQGFENLRGHKYCVLVTYKRSGEPVPTPVWFGLADGNVYVRSEAGVAKVRRIRADPRVRVAPCTVRGKPLGSPVEGQARVLNGPAEESRAEAALRANYGLGRRAYEGVVDAFRVEAVYLEITPSQPAGPTSSPVPAE